MVLFLDYLIKQKNLSSFSVLEGMFKIALFYVISNIKSNKNILELNSKSNRSSYGSLLDTNTANNNSKIQFPAYFSFKTQAKAIIGSVSKYWIFNGTLINFGANDNTLITHEIGISEEIRLN